MKLIAEYRAEKLTSPVVPYVTLKEIAHGMVCLSESNRRVNFRDSSVRDAITVMSKNYGNSDIEAWNGNAF